MIPLRNMITFVIILLLFNIYICALPTTQPTIQPTTEPTREDLFLESLKLLVDNDTDVLDEKSLFHPEKDVHFWLYTRYNYENYTVLNLGNVSSIKNSNFNFSLPTKLLVHGWLSSGSTFFAADLKDAYLNAHDVNVINVDWPAFNLYTLARLAVKPVALVVAKFIDFLIKDVKVDESSIHLLGHSLGAHVAGIAGKNLKSKSLPWITGFDPALPLFTDEITSRLDSSDADFVDIIHTSGGFLGIYESIGHVDFYPNGGTPIQPGCGFDIGICSHCRSYEYYIDALENPIPFLAVPCDSFTNFKNGHCCSGIVEMGPNVNKEIRGKYYLFTSDSTPFALGKRSIVDPCWATSSTTSSFSGSTASPT
ncbi:pancreatic triacylglycerol lipase-like isoform X2 [Lycorma delicatula]|uniref:pancreatic triacylglycerol lipase-like isoform X2 n=1 Tax=Lycorma delicatula TaxID=130591 RepID=UPI003F50F06D